MITNKDLDANKWFLHAESHRWARLNEIVDQPLSREIYFSPSYSPLIDVKNTALGSCFKGWIVPTASIDIETGIEIFAKTTTIDEYTHAVHRSITKSVHDIYSNHQQVHLALSGGIDSVVLLSYVLELNYLDRTTIVIFENHSQSHSDCLHQNISRQNDLDNLCGGLGHTDIKREIIEMPDLIAAANHSFGALRCYVTHALMSRYQSCAWMFGYHGNQLLLHKEVFLDEIMYRAPNKKSLIKTAISKKNFYTQSLRNYRFDRELAPLHQHHLLLKPWQEMNAINNNLIYAPIGHDDILFDLCRTIDFSLCDPEVITDALVARCLIRKNGQEWLLDHISTESTRDLDNLEHVEVPVRDLDPTLLEIPHNLNHDKEGLDWIADESNRAKTTGYIALNTLVSLRNLSWIAEFA